MEHRIEELAREKMNGKSYSAIREELSESGMSAGEISRLIRKVDERVLQDTAALGKPDRGKQWYRFGLILAVAGLLISISYNAGILLERFPALLVYSPFFAGILFMFYGRFQLRKESTPESPATGAIRKRRPYK